MKEICDDRICVQYAHDSNIYKHCKTTSIEENIVTLEKILDEVYKWSKYKTLIFSPDKKNLWYSQQLNQKYEIQTLNLTQKMQQHYQELIQQKSLVSTFSSNWDDHITELSKTCYATLSARRKWKEFLLLK